MKLELISFKLCPYVQRSVIVLREKGAPFDITYIDLNAPPDWFKAISPLGKVPLLRVDDDTVLFESTVISEFVDEVTPGALMPEDPIQRAVNRAWVVFGSDCQDLFFQLTGASDEVGFNKASDTLMQRFGQLENQLGDGPFFNGDRLSLVDTTFAPLFMRLELLSEERPVYDKTPFPKLAAWSRELLEFPAVRESVVPEFPKLFKGRMLGIDSYASEHFFQNF